MFAIVIRLGHQRSDGENAIGQAIDQSLPSRGKEVDTGESRSVSSHLAKPMTWKRWTPIDPSLSLAGALADLRARTITPTGLVRRCLRAIDRFEPSVQAWVSVDRENALRLAAEADDRQASGSSSGPLDGIPIGVKDIIDIEGMTTSAGAHHWANGPAKRDAEIVARLRAAGAIPLGKTVTTPYAWIDPPVTRNPWHLNRTPGGSSSGSAAAVASGMCLGALGSQTGGSITRPAAFCGVSGLKPTYGRLSADGIVPLAASLDHPGLIARTAGDLRILWRVVAGTASDDVNIAAYPRIGRLRGMFESRAEACAVEAVDSWAGRLASAGVSVVDVELPGEFDTILSRHRLIMAKEASVLHRRRFEATPEDYPPRIAELIAEGLRIDESTYQQKIARLSESRGASSALFAGCDLIVTPAALGPAPDLSTTGDPAFNSPWSYLGLPTVSMPVALSEDGMPMGVQMVGPGGSESRLLAWAAWAEQDRDDES